MAQSDYGAWEDIDRLVAERATTGWKTGQPLNYHTYGCFGCGPGNQCGFNMTWHVDRNESGVIARTKFSDRFMGGRGILHGGAIAAVLDDALGAVFVRNLTPVMTVSLAVSYYTPVLVGVDSVITARLDSAIGRSFTAQASLYQANIEAATAKGNFRLVSSKRLMNYGDRALDSSDSSEA